MKISGDVHKRK